LPLLKDLSLLEVLSCEHNNLSTLPYYNNTFQLECSGNPIYNIIRCHDFVLQTRINTYFIIFEELLFRNCVMKENNSLFNHFREVYFLSKLKKKFLSWMWKSREIRIKERYDPKYLFETIKINESNEEFDLDDFLNTW
jgi:hypothetical protein